MKLRVLVGLLSSEAWVGWWELKGLRGFEESTLFTFSFCCLLYARPTDRLARPLSRTPHPVAKTPRNMVGLYWACAQDSWGMREGFLFLELLAQWLVGFKQMHGFSVPVLRWLSSA